MATNVSSTPNPPKTPKVSQEQAKAESTESPQARTGKSKKGFIILAVSLILIFAGGLGVYYYMGQTARNKQGENHANNQASGNTLFSDYKLPQFAKYEPVKVELTYRKVDYSIQGNLANVYEAKRYVLTDKQRQAIVKNGFVVVPSNFKEFYQIYEYNRYHFVPSFITTDSVLHSYHLLFDTILRDLEEYVFYKKLINVSKYLLAENQKYYAQIKASKPTSEWLAAAKQNIAFVSVGLKLLDPKFEAPAEVKTIVDKEIALISAHKGLAPSPYIAAYNNPPEVKPNPFLEDYSQYVPRGHYTKSEILKRYFKAMMWYGRMPFRAKSKVESKAALLMSYALAKNPVDWAAVYDPTAYLVGQADDLTYYDYDYLAKKVYGKQLKDLDLNTLMAADKFADYWNKLPSLREAKINSMVLMDPKVEKASKKEQTQGFRLMGQRFVLDAYVFQQLVYRELKPNREGKKRMLPTALDVPAAFGSDLALSTIKEIGGKEYLPGAIYGGSNFPNYLEKMTALRKYINDIKPEEFNTTVYGGWLYTIKALLSHAPKDAPKFMRNKAWEYKNLNTYLGSFTELKHDTILYAKQAYSELGGAAPLGKQVELDWHGFVEPQVDVYARLLTISKMLDEGLKARGLWNYRGSRLNLAKHKVEVSGENRHKQLVLLNDWLDKLIKISQKELAGTNLDDKDYEFIKTFGGKLEHLWASVNDLGENEDVKSYVDINPAAIVSDVATDPNGKVLELAEGYPQEIIVAVYDKNRQRIKLAVGAVYSYYEFLQPLSNRLTDEAWRDLLAKNKAPAQPKWVNNFVVSDGRFWVKQVPVIKDSSTSLQAFKNECANYGWTFKEHYNECQHLNKPGCKVDVPACLPY